MMAIRQIKRIKVRTAALTLLTLGACAIVFHVLVLAGVVPYRYVWGGRIEQASQMYVFEAVSIAVLLMVMALVAMRGGFMQSWVPRKVTTLALGALAILFALNTAGNMLAQTTLEMAIATPLTLISAVLCARLALRD